jgi:hypothetical protein
MLPQVFNDVDIWRRCGPREGLNVVVFEPSLCNLGCMLWIVILLKYDAAGAGFLILK